MQYFSIAKGRKKKVAKFTARQGLWIIGAMMLLGMVLIVLLVYGLLNVDAD